jgi:hypothetical protein
MSDKTIIPKPALDIFVNKNAITYKTIIGRLSAIMGISGSGKSNTAGRIIETLLELPVSLTIIDGEGEYWGLKEQYEILVAGGQYKDIDLPKGHAKELARAVLENRLPIILDLSDLIFKEERNSFVREYLEEIWNLEHKLRIPHIIILEEAHEYIPQGVKSDLKEILSNIALLGRKWGISTILISQRSQDVEKKVLSQAHVYFLHQVGHPADLVVYYDLLGGWANKSEMTRNEFNQLVQGLKVGEVLFKEHESVERLIVQQQKTFHAGETPDLEKDVRVTPDLKIISKDLLKSFQDIIKEQKAKEDETERLKKQLIMRDSEMVEMRKRMMTLEQQLEITSRLKVELPSEQVIENAVIQHLEARGIIPVISPQPEKTASLTSITSDKSEPTKSDRINPVELGKPYTKKVENLLNAIKELPLHEQRIVQLLVIRAPNSFTSEQISNWLEYSTGYIQNNPPMNALNLHIIERYRDAQSFLYRSRLLELIHDRFEVFQPEIILLQRITKCIQDWVLDLAFE